MLKANVLIVLKAAVGFTVQLRKECAERAGAEGQVEKRDRNPWQVMLLKLKPDFTSAASGESLREERDGSPGVSG